MSKNALVIGAVVVIVVIIALVLGTGRSTAPVGDSDEKPNAGLIVGPNALYVADQLPSQNVNVGVVKLETAGYVVIHDDNSGAPGAIVGQSALLPAGESRDVLVPLNRAARDQETLFAMIHLDDGDGRFDAAKDAPATDEALGPVMMMFTVSNEAEEPSAISL